MKTAKRLTALFLSLVLLFTAMPLSVSADDAVTEAMMQGVFERFEAYNEMTDSNHVNMQLREKYGHCRWVDAIESAKTEHQALLWATHKLMDRDLDTDTYIRYLSAILAMMDKGLADTLQAQAEYTAAHSPCGKLVGKTLDGVLELDIGEILDSETLSEVNGILKVLKLGVDDLTPFFKGTYNMQQAWMLMYCVENAKQKTEFLEAIMTNADDDDLESAAAALWFTAYSPLLYLCFQINDMAEYYVNDTIQDIEAGDNLSDLFYNLLDEAYAYFDPNGKDFIMNVRKLGIDEKSLTPKMLRGLTDLIACTKYIGIGFEIGGAIGNVIWGDELDMFFEMRAMDEIGRALSAGLYDAACNAVDYSGRSKYNAIHKMVAVGQGLVYVRMRGEFCAAQSARSAGTAPENLDDIYADSVNNLTRYYNALATIFPPVEEPQVIVETHTDVQAGLGDNPQVHIALPHVVLPGREEIADKINNSKDMVEMRSIVAGDLKWVAESAEYSPHCTYNFHPVHIFSAGNVLSMRFADIAYTGGAHPISYEFGLNYDLTTGEELKISDLLTSTALHADDKLAELFAAQAAEYGEEAAKNAPAAVREVIANNYDIWCFTEEGLQITFSPYDIASYSAGYIDLVVPYTSLDGVILEKYLIPDRAGLVTDGFPSVFDREEILSDKSFTNFYGLEARCGLSTGTDKIYEVTLARKSAFSDQPYGVLFYANYMKASDVCWMHDEYGPDYLVTYTSFHLDDTGFQETLHINTAKGAENLTMETLQ